MNPFFSVVIPTLNEENYLPRLLKDLGKQAYQNFEVLIVDGYSLDETIEKAKEYQKTLPLRLFESNKKNVSAQRNFGATQAKGKYLVFLDADTRIKPTFLKKLLNSIEKNKGLLFIPYITTEKNDSEYKPLLDLSNLLVEFSQNIKRRFSLGGAIIAEKHFFELVGGFNEKIYLSEDHELVQRMAQWGVNAKFMRDNQVTFCLRRIKKEGQIKFFYKYFVAASRRFILNEEIKNKIFEYNMGGQFYAQDKKTKNEFFFQKYAQDIKLLFKKVLKELGS